MKRTLNVGELPVASIQPGTLVVAAEFTDPDRGVATCTAAPLLAESLAGVPVSIGRLAEDAVAGEGVLFAASFLDRAGRVRGLGVAACRDDPAMLALAEETMATWVTVLRSRRVLVAAETLCRGGRRALEMAEAATVRPERVFSVGRPVAGEDEIAHLERSGVAFAGSVAEVPDGAVVVWPAHGAELAEHAQAAARGLEVVDGTCPLAAGAQANAAAYAARGDTVVVIGDPSHAVLPVLAAAAGEGAHVVGSAAEADGLVVPDGSRVSFVVDSAMPVEEAMPIVAALRQRFPALAGHHFDLLCEHASHQAQAVRLVVEDSDLVLFMDGADPQAAAGRPARVVAGLADLNADLLREAVTVGMVCGPDAARGLRERIVQALAGLGPVTVGHRSVHTSAVKEVVRATV
ncbi:hypothetical protein ACIBG8_10030 [Nonomuraea sp. NPDC050556]|uniref:hypothetical protein n=1 Tax=Nonomuraea sp. NPDC050556 TaxID=3364369 RepID=UPI0037AA8646